MPESTYTLSDGYSSLAAECVYSPDNYPRKEVDFLERRIREKGGKALELACGAGRHLVPLVKRGLNVDGSDAGADAIRFAHMAAEKNGVAPKFHHQSMEGLDLPDRYGTIFIVNGSFEIMSDRTMAMEALRRFYDQLRAGRADPHRPGNTVRGRGTGLRRTVGYAPLVEAVQTTRRRRRNSRAGLERVHPLP